MIIRCTLIAEGPGPSEAVVGVVKDDGHQEEVVISRRLMQDGMIDVGSPLLSEQDRVLIELPRESTSGRWRIWIPRSEVINVKSLQAAE